MLLSVVVLIVLISVLIFRVVNKIGFSKKASYGVFFVFEFWSYYYENSGYFLAIVVSCGVSKTVCGEIIVFLSGIFLS